MTGSILDDLLKMFSSPPSTPERNSDNQYVDTSNDDFLSSSNFVSYENYTEQENIEDLYSIGQIVHGNISHTVRGGVRINIDGYSCFMPTSQLDTKWVENEDEYVGTECDVQILEIDPVRQSMVVSRKAVLKSRKENTSQDEFSEKTIAQNPAESDEAPSIHTEITDTQRGTIYLTYAATKRVTIEELRDRISKKLLAFRKNRPNDFNISENEDVLEYLEDILLPRDGRVKDYFISNCSHERRECPTCTMGLEDQAACSLKKNACNTVLLRPDCNLPSLEEIFPGDEILAPKAFVWECPLQKNGSVLAIIDYVWVPKCEKRVFEVEISARCSWERRRNEDNIINGTLVAQLPPISMITRQKLDLWKGYLEWRRHLITVNKKGIRYLSWKLDLENLLVSFTVIASDEEQYKTNQFWKRDTTYVYPLTCSENEWIFQEARGDNLQYKYGKELGDFESEQKLPETNKIIEECPWDSPFFSQISFAIPEEIRERLDGQSGDDRLFQEEDIKRLYPEQGFLSTSSIGDESLIRRMERILGDFAKEGSNSSPYLSSFIFDITQARLPKEKISISEFLNKNLNDSQKTAVEVMLSAPDIALIQGPPGTGKTTVIAEAIYQFAVKNNKKVLLASQSIAAVDNALDRLENIPEIRAVRLKKNTRYSKAYDDATRYSEADVLKNFYDTLGVNAQKTIQFWRDCESDIKKLESFLNQLRNFSDRLETEHQIITNEQSSQDRLRDRLAVILKKEQENILIQKQKAASDDFMQLFVSGKEFSIVDADNIPKDVFILVEKAIIEKFNLLAKLGIKLCPIKYDSELSNAQKVDFYNYLLKIYYDIKNFLLTEIRKDYDYIVNLDSEEIMDSNTALEVAKLDSLMKDVIAKRNEADDSGNEELYQSFEKQRRDINKKIKELQKTASLSPEKYQRIFNKDVIAYITDPQRKKSELVQFFGNFFLQIEAAFSEISDVINNLNREIDDFTMHLALTEGIDDERTKVEHELRKASEKINDAQKRIAEFNSSADKKINELNGLFHTKNSDLLAAINWSEKAYEFRQQQLRDSSSERKLLEPMLLEWMDALSSVNDMDKEYVLDTYLNTCSVVGVTCTSDSRILKTRGYDHFDVVIIDEVSKATPPELLLPMLMAEKIILVGDHRQLPPLFGEREPKTIEEIMQQEEEDQLPESMRITKENFRKYKKLVTASLFKEYFENAPSDFKSSLWVQHRMHPDIMQIINEFYENKLTCGLDKPEHTRNHLLGKVSYLTENQHAYWIDSTVDPCNRFFEEETSGSSKINYLEAQLICQSLLDIDQALQGQLYPIGTRDKSGKDISGTQIKKSVGIIAFYGKQTGLLKRMINKLKFKNLNYRVDTVDRFQGQERDYILVSITRNISKSGYKHANSFVAQFERINVAFSRARELLLIFGSQSMLMDYPIELPRLDAKGPATKQYVYKRIISNLARKGCLVRSSDIISIEKWSNELLPQYKRKANNTIPSRKNTEKRQGKRGIR